MKTLKITKTVNSTTGVKFEIKVNGNVVRFKEAVQILTNSDEFGRSFDNVYASRGNDVIVYIKDYKKPIRIGTQMTAKEAVMCISDLVVAILNGYELQYPDSVETAEAVFFV